MSGAIPYWFSQRFFQKLEGGRVLCHPDGVEPLRRMLASWVGRRTTEDATHEIVAIEPDSDVPIRQNIGLRAIETHHTCPSLGFSIIETRHKLKAEYRDLPQSELRRLKADGGRAHHEHRDPADRLHRRHRSW